MAHNSLRRAIVDYLSGTPKDYGTGLLQRALDALGGPVAAQVIPDRVTITTRPFTPAEVEALDSYKGVFGTPRCPPVDAVSTKETGADCTRNYLLDRPSPCVHIDGVGISRDEDADRETIELINRRRLHGFTWTEADNVPELRYDYLHREPTEDDDA